MQDIDISMEENKKSSEYSIEDFKEMLLSKDADANNLAYIMLDKSLDISTLGLRDLCTLDIYVCNLGAPRISDGESYFMTLVNKIRGLVAKYDYVKRSDMYNVLTKELRLNELGEDDSR